MSKDVDLFFVDIAFKTKGLEPLLAAIWAIDKGMRGDEEREVKTEWVELSSTELGDGRILQTRMLQPVETPSSPQPDTLEEEIADILERVLPDCLTARVLPFSGALTIDSAEEESISWLELGELRNLFDLFAPYLEEESRIEFSETLWNIWRWVVKDGKIIEQAGEITYD